MSKPASRRSFMKTSLLTSAALSASSLTAPKVQAAETNEEPLKIGLMTWLLGSEWDIETIIKNCTEVGWKHAELRTTHAHGVEVSLTKPQRQDVRKRFEDAGMQLSLASAFAYHWNDKAKLKEHIEGTKKYTKLAHDIGALGIRVFPNAVLTDQGIPEERTLEQIGKAVAEVGEFAHDYGVEIRLSNHGRGTNRVYRVKKIIDYADSPHVYMNWNCDATDVEDPGFEANFAMVKDRIRNLHIHDLWNPNYPYRKLFSMLRKEGYTGYCDAEVKQSKEPITFMKYYTGLFLALQNAL